MITLEEGQFGWDYIIRNLETNESLLIQSDWDYPGVARTFGWSGEDGEITEAQLWLDEHIGDTADDPGYFYT